MSETSYASHHVLNANEKLVFRVSFL